MKLQQHTIQHRVVFEGTGLYTGQSIHVTLLPMPVHTGICLQRIDLPQQPSIEATVANVVATERNTVIAKDTLRVAGVEHLLAAVMGLQIDNICIQLDGPEVPDLDGSALAFTQLLAPVRLQQEAPRVFWKIREKFRYEDPDTGSCFEVYPDDGCAFHCTIAYNRWPLAYQYATLDTLDHFQEEIAAARTFVYLDEIVALYRQGLFKGSEVAHALILYDRMDAKELIEELRQLSGKAMDHLMFITPDLPTPALLHYVNEPARHELLDLIGNLALLGRSLQGKVFAHKPGHGANIRFVKALRKWLLQQENKGVWPCDMQAPPILDVQQIGKLLPHRYPFQLVDKIIQIDETRIMGVKNVTINEPFFQGHFPGIPVMPGVLQIEALAQTGGVLVLYKLSDAASYLTYFLSIDRCKFRRVVVPGDTLILQCQLLTPVRFNAMQTQGIAKVEGRIFVKDHLTCEAVLLAQIVKQHAPAIC